MKEIGINDLIKGVNDSLLVLHLASDQRENPNFSTKDLYYSTKEKRRWSIINPGIILAQAYMYFVLGQEKGLLKDYPSKDDSTQFIKQFRFKDDEYQSKPGEDKKESIKRHLRNAIAHIHYKFYINNPNGKITKDGDVLIVFEDFKLESGSKKYYCKFEISFTDFANLIENTGEVINEKTRRK